jgi:hypothetical protein
MIRDRFRVINTYRNEECNFFVEKANSVWQPLAHGSGGRMPIPDMNKVKALLASREHTLSRIMHEAWDRWRNNPDRLVLDFRRTRATAVHNLMMRSAPEAFSEDDGIELIDGQETTYFVVQQKLVFRLKMGDECGISSNKETQLSLAFVDPQQSLPGIPDLDRVDIVYVLNPFETQIANILVVARDRKRVVWQYPIYPRPDEGDPPIPFPTSPVSPTPTDNVVRLPPVRKKKKDDK